MALPTVDVVGDFAFGPIPVIRDDMIDAGDFIGGKPMEFGEQGKGGHWWDSLRQ